MVRIKRNIYLTGFMGTGKTTVGVLLACRLNVPFSDTDAIIEKKFKMSIRSIFLKNGEDFFRREEVKTILGTLHSQPHVVSVGGGAVLRHSNREILRQGLWINLASRPAEIWKRTGKDKTRPLLKGRAKMENMESLMKQRAPCYRLSPFQVETDGISPRAVVEIILKIIARYGFHK